MSHRADICLALEDNVKWFPDNFYQFKTPLSLKHEHSSLSTLLILAFKFFNNLVDVQWSFVVVLIFIFLITNDTDHFFKCELNIWMSFFFFNDYLTESKLLWLAKMTGK